MKRYLLNELLRPALHRAGTGVGAALAGYGLSAADIQTVIAALTVLGGLLVDLLLRKVL